MKKLLIVLLIAAIAVSCNDGKKEEVRYTQDSKEINTLKAAIKDYEDANWESYSSHYADTAKIYHNSKESLSSKQQVDIHKENTSPLSAYGFVDDDDEFEMVLTDDNNTWVNYWGTWKGTIAENSKEVTIPIHLTARFVNGKIVEEHGYWDNGIFRSAMEEMEASKAKQDSIQGAEQ